MAKGIYRNVLVIEQNPELRSKFSDAFQRSGYRVHVSDGISNAVQIISRGNQDASRFDLVIVDSIDRKSLGQAVDAQNIAVPFFTLKDAADKLMLIDLLNQNRVEFLENFIKYHEKI